MKTLTLAYLFHDNQILLGMKKKGFGIGKWNGFGGKLEEGETPLDAIVREIKEESGLIMVKGSCIELGQLDFYFDDREEWNQRVVVYRIDDFNGEPQETDEMKPQWFAIPQIPYDKMWKSDKVWIQNVIARQKFTGEVHLDDNGERVVSCDIK